jgi:hypothetical protein
MLCTRLSRTFIFFSLALTACFDDARHARSCATDSDCPPGVQCSMGACLAGRMPTAHIGVRSGSNGLVTHRPIVFDASGSADPNPNGRIVAYDWSVQRRPGTHCDASPARGTTATLQTIFSCEGQYVVGLKVKGALDIESALETLDITVAASQNAPVATAGAGLTLSHRCSGTPLVCTTVGEGGDEDFQLTVEAADVESGAALTYAWSWDPPDGVERSAVQVRFTPSSAVSSPLVHIESAGTRIAGEWTFTAHATDSDGLVTLAQQKVNVLNRAPVVTAAVPAMMSNHMFSEQGQVYVAADTLRAHVTDPDGDPVEIRELRLVEDSPTGCGFRVLEAAMSGGDVAVSYELIAGRGQEQQFIGPARTLALVIRDANGAEGSVTLPLVVLNRKPQLVWRPGVPGVDARLVTVPHRFGPDANGGSGFYLTEGSSPLLAVDPDGDPLTGLELVTRGAAPGVSLASPDGVQFSVKADAASALDFRGTDGKAPFTIVARVRDPWERSAEGDGASFRLEILNTPPRLLSLLSPTPSWSYLDDVKMYSAFADIATFVDDDGDPLALSQSTDDPPCGVALLGNTGRVFCGVVHDWTSGHPSGLDVLMIFPRTVALGVTDAWAQTAPVTSRFVIRDANSPTNPGGAVTGEGCECRRNADPDHPYAPDTWAPGGTVRFSFPISDRDGTPLWVSIGSIQCGALTSPARLSLLGGAVEAQLDLTGCGGFSHATIDASDGMVTSIATYELNVTCSRSGELCGTPPEPR